MKSQLIILCFVVMSSVFSMASGDRVKVTVKVKATSIDINIRNAEYDSKVCVQAIFQDGANLWGSCQQSHFDSALWFSPNLLENWSFTSAAKEWSTALQYVDSSNPAVISNLQPGIYKIFVRNPSNNSTGAATFKIEGETTYKATVGYVEDFSSGEEIVRVPMVSFSPIEANLNAVQLMAIQEPINKDFEKIYDHYTGDPEGRFNILFLGDSITEDRLPLYRKVIEDFKTEFFNTEPYKSYSNYINLISVNVISPPKTRYINIYANGSMHYGRAPELKRFYFNKADIVAVKVSGGAPGKSITVQGVYSEGYALNAGHEKVMMHEFGHHHGFSDNYTATETFCGYPGANVSSTSNPAVVPWREWLKHGTQTVRANSCGRFQSSDNGNMMRSANARSEYGPFLHEQILVDLYRKNFHVITSYTPEGRISNFSHIDIEPMRPISHEFDVFWTANGKNITPVNSKSLVRSDLKGFSGLVTLQVKVVDPTTLVRSERFRDELMTKTLTWTVDLNESPAPELPTPPAPPTSPSPDPPAPPVTEPIFDPVGKFCSYKHWPHGGADSLQEELLYGDKVTRHLAGKESTESCSAGAQGSKVYRTYFSQVITCKLNSTSSGVILAQISKNEITEEVENTCKIP